MALAPGVELGPHRDDHWQRREGLHRLGVPSLFIISTGVFAAIFVAFGVAVVLGETRVLVRGGAIRVVRGLAGLTLSDRTIEAGAISQISAIPGATRGNIVYSRIRLNYVGSRTLDFGDGIRVLKQIGWRRR
jgi:hypothetical protein